MIYTESDLIIPTLNYLFLHKTKGLKTSELIVLLSKELEITGKDAEKLRNRNDSHFSQKVRNLVSHRTLETKGLATYLKVGRDGLHKITNKGERYLLENIDNFAFVISNNFNSDQRKNVIEKDYSGLVIEEGFLKYNQVKSRTRSRQLVKIAKQHFMSEGKLFCSACNFNFENFYGNIGRNYIEIHHVEPIFARDKGFKQSILSALEQVAPVCSNCHSMIHRRNDRLLSIPTLQQIIHANGIFTR